mgnify:CR=1 FL=1
MRLNFCYSFPADMQQSVVSVRFACLKHVREEGEETAGGEILSSLLANVAEIGDRTMVLRNGSFPRIPSYRVRLFTFEHQPSTGITSPRGHRFLITWRTTCLELCELRTSCCDAQRGEIASKVKKRLVSGCSCFFHRSIVHVPSGLTPCRAI